MDGRQRAYSLFSTVALGLVAGGCSGGAGGDDKPREPVSGTVTLDSQPLPEGIILFIPAGPAGEAVASATGKIENGAFSIPRTEGPVPGNYKVSISQMDLPEGHVKIQLKKSPKKTARTKEHLPAKYNSQTILKEEIKKGGASGLKYELQSK